jgi:hypothetical protein
MRIQIVFVVLLLSASNRSFAAASTEAPHVVGQDQMQAAIAARTGDEAAKRGEIQRLLARPEVRRLAETSGLDLERARAAAANLEGDELQRLAGQAALANGQLEGGSTIVIASSTVIIILLIVLLLVLI